MAPRTQIDLFNLKDKNVTFWSTGNSPTQNLYGLSASEVLAHLKALYLLSDKILAAGSFYFESDVTRQVTSNLQLLFERGDILYFVDSSTENFAEHGLKKIEKSPPGLRVYRDKPIIAERAKTLDSLGYILRRPDYSISDRIVELWINDMMSRHTGTVGECLARVVKDMNNCLALGTELINFAQSRQKDFVWEYLGPKLMQMELPREFQRVARRRLAQMYSLATAEFLNVSLDRPERALHTPYITAYSHSDTGLFLDCMEILGVRNYFYDEHLTPIKLIELKHSEQFIYFSEFYFRLIEVTACQHTETNRWLQVYRDAAVKYSSSGITTSDFLKTFKALCNALDKPSQKYSRPLEILLRIYDSVTHLAIEHFIEKMGSLFEKKAVPDINISGSLEIGPIAPSQLEGIKMIKILFLAANTSGDTKLRLDKEYRAIEERIRMSEFRDRFEIRSHWAVRVDDIQRLLLQHKPHIVHFCGHGTESGEIILEGPYGDQPVSVEPLKKLFNILKDNIQCVVLNACYSEEQARAIAEYIDCVIGISETIEDNAAISFAASFYQALGYGRNVQTAFDLGCLELDLENLGEQDKPKLLTSKGVDPQDIMFSTNC